MNLTLENLSKSFKDKWAVKNFSVELTEGVYGLLGPNGSGKTTLLRMIVDILKPSSGRILVEKEDIYVMDDRYRDLLGYLPQQFGVYRSFTAQRFLMYIASLKGLSKSLAEEKVGEMLDLVNLASERNRKIGTFSGGMKQRLGIAQALLNDPKILVLDEPTAGLDPKERIRFRNLISEISGERIVILSTHIVSDIEYAAKEVMMIKEGQLIKKASPADILRSLEGKVWKVVIPEASLNEVQKRFSVGNILRKNEGLEVRITSDGKPLENAEPVSPGFEDIYLYYFNGEVLGNGTIEARAI